MCVVGVVGGVGHNSDDEDDNNKPGPRSRIIITSHKKIAANLKSL